MSQPVKYATADDISAEVRAELRDLARDIAHDAGALVKKIRREGVEIAATKSTDTDVVTVADRAAEDRVRELLSRHRPDDGVLGEEDGSAQGTSGLTWVVDPIDGTVNYLHGITEYSVSIAVVVGPPDPARWQVIAGCVYRPDDGNSFEAALGLGAFQGSQRLQIAPPVQLGHALVATGFGYDAQMRAEQVRVLAGVLPKIADIRRFGSAALELGNLAAGRYDAFYETGLNPWDLAAGELLVTEAGGVVTGINGRPAGYDLTVAGHPQVVADLARLLEELHADEIV